MEDVNFKEVWLFYKQAHTVLHEENIYFLGGRCLERAAEW